MHLNILYSCNENYIMQAGVSILSLCEENMNFEEINIYFVEDGLSEQSKKNLIEIIKPYSANIQFYRFKQFCTKLTINNEGRHPNTIFAKLFADQLLEVNKILYIDCDIIINGSFLELWTLDMKENIIAGVLMPYDSKIKKKLGIDEKKEYICDGFVLMDLEKWRNENITEECMKYINDCGGAPPMQSEGTINRICSGRIMKLEPKYNLMPFMLLLDSDKIIQLFGVKSYYLQEEIYEARKAPIVIHYINELYNRPWNKKCDHPYKEKFIEFLRKTPWGDYELGMENIKNSTKIIRWGIKYLPLKVIRLGRNLLQK